MIDSRYVDAIPPDTAREEFVCRSLQQARLPQQQAPEGICCRFYIHDGFTGSLIGQRSFATAGRWEHNVHQAIGFSNAAFWQDEFGQRVAEQVDAMAEEINTTLRCQPFTAIITRTDDYNILVPRWSGLGY